MSENCAYAGVWLGVAEAAGVPLLIIPKGANFAAPLIVELGESHPVEITSALLEAFEVAKASKASASGECG